MEYQQMGIKGLSVSTESVQTKMQDCLFELREDNPQLSKHSNLKMAGNAESVFCLHLFVYVVKV
tara:strand:+ start:241 stop:432 length:192 start_codon:yes stop_codon:yes gene_type:complete